MKSEIQTLYFKIIRRTSKYNKYIKWFVECYRDKECTDKVSSSGYRTEKEARNHVLNGSPIAIGNRMVWTKYVEIAN